jgi:hypothetical protein
MIIPIIVAVGLAGAGGYFLARRGALSEKEVRRRIEESKQKAIAAARTPSPLPQEAYRPPDPAAVINTPVDAEDFAQMQEAFCVCYRALLEDAGNAPSAEQLRDCFLKAIYPDFVWPPVPGDPSSAQLMWMIASHEAKKLLIDPSACTQAPTPGGGGGPS